jgi:hypothetical protein
VVQLLQLLQVCGIKRLLHSGGAQPDDVLCAGRQVLLQYLWAPAVDDVLWGGCGWGEQGMLGMIGRLLGDE